MTRLQKCMMWLLRQSHRWERLGFLLLGATRYQAVKNWAWRLYIGESLRSVRRSDRRQSQP